MYIWREAIDILGGKRSDTIMEAYLPTDVCHDEAHHCAKRCYELVDPFNLFF